MVDTIKFSEFANGGDLENANVTVGLKSGANTYFNNPWTFLASGTTAERPAVPDPAVSYRLRFNTTLLSYEFYNANTAAWQQVEDSGDIAALIADLASHAAGKGASMIGLQDQTGVLSKTVQDLANAKIIAQTTNGTLTNGQFLSDLSTGALKNTTGTGVLSISAPLTSIDGLVTAADEMIYLTGADTYATTPLTSFARTLLDDANAAAAAVTLEVLPLAGGTMTGVIDMGSNQITSVTDPTLAQDAATKNYVDTTLSGGYLPLSGGTMAGNISMDDTYQITNMIDPVSAQDAATKHYVDSVASGLNIQAACVCATTANLTATYANGAAGIGATLTNTGALAAFSSDGYSPGLNDRVLVKNQSSTLENGIYTLTTVGDGVTAWVLTRATDYDEPAEIQPGDLVNIINGTLYAGSGWLQTATITTIGTDPITFIQFSASIPVSVPNGGTGLTTVTAYALIAGGTTSTTPFQSLATGSTGQILQSQGNAALPAYSTATYPSTATSSGTFMRADGTNWVASTATIPGTAGTSGTLLQSNGTNWVNTTATYPGTGGTSGTILISNGTNWVNTTATYPTSATTSGTLLRANGTNWVASTATYPDTATGTGTFLRADGTNWVASTLTIPNTASINTIPYASSANVWGAIAAVNDAVMVSSAAGVPSMSTNIPTAVTIGSAYIYRAGGTDVPVTDGGTGASTATNARTNLGIVWELISTSSASSSASIAFTNLSSTYIKYVIELVDVVAGTDAVAFWVRTSTNNGSSYDSGASDYQWALGYYNTGSVSVTATGDAADAQISMWGSVDNTNPINGRITINSHSSAGNPCTIMSEICGKDGSTGVFGEVFCVGIRDANADVDAIQMLMSSGNIASGTFNLYGLKAATVA